MILASTGIILAITGIILGIAIIIFGRVAANQFYNMKNADELRSTSLLGGIAIALILTLVGVLQVLDAKDLQTKLASGYTVYVDGQEADSSKIDIEQYVHKINDETKEIYLTRR